jgi:hypothetical protein
MPRLSPHVPKGYRHVFKAKEMPVLDDEKVQELLRLVGLGTITVHALEQVSPLRGYFLSSRPAFMILARLHH